MTRRIPITGCEGDNLNPLDYVHVNRSKWLDELKEFLSIPSVSTQAEHKPDIERAARWLRDQLQAVGFPKVEVMPTAGHPIVYAEWLAAGPSAPTLLIYGHYDVQPPDPLDLWHTPPFEPTIVGDDLFCRGASDDKGQLYTHVKAIEAFKETLGAPPVNVKCLFEGEEEVGSVNLNPFIVAHKDLLAADVAVISDSHILGKDIPAIVYALRGIAYVEVEVTGPTGDLHSGIYGGAVHNPINALCAMIASLHDEHNRVAIPGFYDAVRDLDAGERAALAKIPFNREAWLKEAGVSADWGDPDYTIVERTSARPTLDVNGIWGGYIEPGAKTVLPSKAFAKISMRLVPDQKHAEIARLIEEHLKAVAPPTVSVAVRNLHGGEGAIVNRDSAAIRAAFQAYEAGFGVTPVFMREGGSIPVVAAFKEELGIDTVLMGFGLPDDNLHAPNEKMHLPNVYKGIETVIHFMTTLGAG
ncbi:MAG: dipeptidase [Anaerolineae bacterium]|nr:dipeptidase [Anaerolineae bacterium]